MRQVFVAIFVLSIVTLSTPTLMAQIRLPSIFSDHMVLQREKELKVWGWSEPGQKIEVAINGQQQTTTATEQGEWKLTLPPQEAGGPYELTVTVNDNVEQKLTIRDVLIGEVWLCSGQSNMEWTVARSKDPRKEIAAADFPQIRHIKMRHRPAPTPQSDINAAWTICSSETVADYTAVGYYFARKLYQELDVPIGLINSSWGGTRIEPWTPPSGFAQVPALSDIYESLQSRTPGTELFNSKLQSHIAATEAWLETAKKALKDEDSVAASPTFPTELTPVQGHQNPSMLYNGMVHNFAGFSMRGTIWYQGEANRADGMMYFEKKKALIQGWREIWNQGDFPFYFVQIAPFQYGSDRPEELAEFWEAQSKTLEIPNTGMVVVSDVGNLKDIHPKNKQAVGARLANIALKNDYGQKDLLVSGPTFESLEVKEDRLVVTFANVGEGLKSFDGQPLNEFQIIGKGTDFENADARISGNQVILTSDKVKHPVAMRFAWNKLATPNLTNSANLPTSSFRAGEVPTALSAVPGIKDYQLVYDLDLGNIGAEINYDVDLRNRVGSFDRIGYFLELKKADQPVQHVFVSMEAFTKDVNKIGIPATKTEANFQQAITDVQVHSNTDLKLPQTESNRFKGHLEFWPNNYGVDSQANIGGSNQIYDFDDTPTGPVNGYGSMQVHIPASKQTVFAINRWSKPEEADLGIGNSPGTHTDWTFSANSGQYVEKRLRVFVRPKKAVNE